MIEYSSHNIDPSVENSFLQLKSSFGWQLVDSNEVYNENTYVSDVKVTTYGNDLFGGFMSGFTGSDGKVQVNTKTEVTNYIHVTLARDTDIPNYEKICDNEDRFWTYANASEPKKPTVLTAVFTMLSMLMIASLITSAVNGTAIAVWEIVMGVTVPVAAAIILFFAWKRYKKKMNLYDYGMQQAEELLTESQSLLQGE